MPSRAIAVLVLLVTGLTSPGATAQTAAPGPAAALSHDEQLAFLASARIVSSSPIGQGTTGVLRVVLSDGLLTHDAAFQSIAVEPAFDGRKRAGELRFVDHYRYNIAAWRLASHVGLAHMMPPTVERTVDRVQGALSWWVDDVMMDEGERALKDLQPPNPRDFTRQRQRMAVFAELVRDTDRNKGNVLYTKDWQLVMLDFTRAFRLQPQLRLPQALTTCDRALLVRLRALRKQDVSRAAGRHLSPFEIDALMKRRDLIVELFDRLAAQRGESAVLF